MTEEWMRNWRISWCIAYKSKKICVWFYNSIPHFHLDHFQLLNGFDFILFQLMLWIVKFFDSLFFWNRVIVESIRGFDLDSGLSCGSFRNRAKLLKIELGHCIVSNVNLSLSRNWKFAQWYCLFIFKRLFLRGNWLGRSVNRVQLFSNRVAPCVGVCVS
jgi:hypothetical protein